MGEIVKYEWAFGSTDTFYPTSSGDTTIKAPSSETDSYLCYLKVTDDDGTPFHGRYGDSGSSHDVGTIGEQPPDRHHCSSDQADETDDRDTRIPSTGKSAAAAYLEFPNRSMN